MQTKISRRAAAAWVAAATLARPAVAAAADYPDKPIRLIVPYPPGGSIDIVARIFAPKVGAILGRPIVIDNRGGGGGAVGGEAIVHAAPDGYTIGLAVPGMLTLPVVFDRSLGFRPETDFTLIRVISENLLGIVVHPDIPAKTLPELLEYARRNPGKVSFSTSGTGSTLHLIGELLNQSAGIDMPHVAYRGAGPQVSDLLGGQVPVGIVTTSSVLQQVKAGRLRMLAIFSDKRYEQLPAVPTSEEALPGFKPRISWTGVVGPADLPPAIVQALGEAFDKACTDPGLMRTLSVQGMPVHRLDAPGFANLISSEIAFWRPVVKKGNIKLD